MAPVGAHRSGRDRPVRGGPGARGRDSPRG